MKKADIFTENLPEHIRLKMILPKSFFSPREALIEPVLYWEGETQCIPGDKEIYTYLASKRIEPIEEKPNIFAYIREKLTEKELAKAGIPSNVNIVFLVPEKSLFWINSTERGFSRIHRREGERSPKMVRFDGGKWNGLFAFVCVLKRKHKSKKKIKLSFVNNPFSPKKKKKV